MYIYVMNLLGALPLHILSTGPCNYLQLSATIMA